MPTNVAAAAAGATATASSEKAPIPNGSGGFWTFPGSNCINGLRSTPYWEAASGAPQSLTVQFAAAAIDTINLFFVQDGIDVPAPGAPGAGTTTNNYGVTAFNLDYWDGSAWVAIPGGTISGNNHAWRQVAFAPITTDRVRLTITATQDGVVRLNEIEALTSLPTLYGVGRLPSPLGAPRGRAIIGAMGGARLASPLGPTTGRAVVAPLGVVRLGSPLGSPTGRGRMPWREFLADHQVQVAAVQAAAGQDNSVALPHLDTQVYRRDLEGFYQLVAGHEAVMAAAVLALLGEVLYLRTELAAAQQAIADLQSAHAP